MPGARPYSLRNIPKHPLARMLPLSREQAQAYRLAEPIPPSDLNGYGPIWEAATVILAARGTAQARVNLQRSFQLIGLTCSSSSNASGGFRAQLYDKKKGLRLADRGVQQTLFGGSQNSSAGLSGVFLLREPYHFDLPDSQLLIVIQNLELVSNTIQIVLYGQALRFNDPTPNEMEFPGGPVSSAWVQNGGGQ